jgi:hypothetical protein
MKSKALLLLALAVAACGGTAADTAEGVASLDASSTTTLAEETTTDPEAAAIGFTECMRENGIEMEDPTVDEDGNVIPGQPTNLPEPEAGEGGQGGPGGALGEELRAGFEECGDLLEGSAFGFTQTDQTELQDQLLELAQCLRDQGLDVADPDLTNPAAGGGPGEGGPFGIDFQDPEMQAALEQCEEFLPNFGGDGPGFVAEIGPPGDSEG